MRIIVDTNIAFSAILNSQSLIGELIFNSEGSFEFFSPQFLKIEIDKYRPKLLKATSMKKKQLEASIQLVYKRIDFLSDKVISPASWHKAYDLVKRIDEKDTPFLATTIELDGILWTGDKKLIEGLRKKKFDKILSTRELYETR
ncbi:MAG: hypothetical protein JXQ96_16880 [Cyclobacteriaceae bacterium]